MAWFGKKKKSKRKPPVLEPVGTLPVQAAPVVQPAFEPVQNVQGVPAIQATPAIQPISTAQEPIVEIAPVGVVADTNVMVSTEDLTPTSTQTPTSTGWAKKSVKPLFDIHKKLDHMMDSKGKSLEERYKDRFGGKLPESVAADTARKEYNEKKANEEEKPKIIFKQRSQLNLKPKTKKPVKIDKKESTVKGEGIGSRIGSGIKKGGTKTKAAFGRAGAAVGRGAGAVKSGIGRGTSRVFGIFRRDKKPETAQSSRKTKTTNPTKKRGRPSKKRTDYKSMKLPQLKAELKKKGLQTSGNKAVLIKRLEN